MLTWKAISEDIRKKSIFGNIIEIMNYEKLVVNITASNFVVDDVFG